MISKILYYLFACKHKTTKYRKWVENDTPMIHIVCIKCGEDIDRGHVYGDIEGWDSNGWDISE